MNQHTNPQSISERADHLEEEMMHAAANLEYERAALLRDQIMELKSGTGIAKIEPKKKPVKYGAGGFGKGRGKRSKAGA